MTERMTYEQLDAKIDWEGGIIDILDYRLSPMLVPEDLEYIWVELMSRYRAYRVTEDYVAMVIEREVKREQSASGS